MIIKDTNGSVIVSGYNRSTDFSLSAQPMTTLVSSATTSTVTIHDALYLQSTGAVVNNVCQFITNQLLNLPALTLTNNTPSIGTVDSTGLVALMSLGTMEFQAVGVQGTRKIDFPISQTSGTTSNSFLSYAPGTLAKAMVDAISSSISGLTPGSGTQAMFSVGAPTYTPNSNLFCKAFDLTCIAQGGNATAISPVHVIEAAHDPFGTFDFIGSDGSVNHRTVVHSDGSPAQSNGDGAQIKIPGTDIAIMRLNTTLPVSVTPAELLPANFRSYLPTLNGQGVPILCTNQFRTIFIRNWLFDPAGQELQIYSEQSGSPYFSWTGNVIVGDSGSPSFAIFGSDVAFLTCWHSGLGGPTWIDNLAAINAAMATLGGGSYMVQTVDLSAYPTP